MNLVKAALHFALPKLKMEESDRFLFFGPHPDDIEIGAGATAAKLAAMGKKVRFVVVTDGRFGSETTEPEKLAGIRKAEALESARLLGVDDVVFLSFSDGGFYDADELYRAMAAEVSAFRPDIIFAPDPCVTSEFHKDHLNVGRAAGNIACFAPYRGIMNEMGLHPAPVRAVAFFMTAKPDVFVRTGKYFRVQMKALSCHKSQFDEGNVIFTYLRLRSLNYGFRKLSLHAEAFRLLSQTELHCLPERGK